MAEGPSKNTEVSFRERDELLERDVFVKFKYPVTQYSIISLHILERKGASEHFTTTGKRMKIQSNNLNLRPFENFRIYFDVVLIYNVVYHLQRHFLMRPAKCS